MELLTVFWQAPRKDQVCIELGDGVILIKDSRTGEPIGMELLSYRPDDIHYDSVSVEVNRSSEGICFTDTAQSGSSDVG